MNQFLIFVQIIELHDDLEEFQVRLKETEIHYFQDMGNIIILPLHGIYKINFDNKNYLPPHS